MTGRYEEEKEDGDSVNNEEGERDTPKHALRPCLIENTNTTAHAGLRPQYEQDETLSW